RAITSGLPQGNMVVLQREGKFAKHKLGLSGGSVGLFEGKRIGRAKNLENLAKEIKAINQRITDLQQAESDQTQLLSSLKSQSKREVIDELRMQLNRIQNEWTSVKTKQEQYQAFISSSQHRKQDIEQKLQTIDAELLLAEPGLKILKAESEECQKLGHDLQLSFQDLNEALSEKTNTFNQENIRLHQQQNKVSGIQKDLEYRESQKEALEIRITKNNADIEKVKSDMKGASTMTDSDDEDLKKLYEQKELLETALQEMEESFYASRKTMNDLEEEVATLRKSKDQLDLLTNDIKDKKTALQLDLNSLKERLSVEFNIDIKDLLTDEMPEIEQSEEVLETRYAQLKKQLDDFGTINPMAKEAYDEITERYNFIAKEKNDLLEA